MSGWIVKTFSIGCRNSTRVSSSVTTSHFSKYAPVFSSSADLSSHLNPTSDSYDPSRAFLQKDVQKILYRVTGFDTERFRRSWHSTEMIKLPTHRFLTVEEWELEKRRGSLGAKRSVKMPPVMAPRISGGEVISEDKQLDKLLEHKMVFTDVSYGIDDRDRTVVVREPSGVLRRATWDEKLRMCQIFIPKQGREIFLPRMFLPEFLPAALDRVSEYYILARACAQFEPDDPDFIRVTHAVYDHVDRKGTYDELWSTRYFGGMVFYLTCVGKLDGLLLDRLQRVKVADAADIVRLRSILHPLSKSALTAKRESTETSSSLSDRRLLQIYIETTANVKDRLDRALGRCAEEAGDQREDAAVAQ